MTAVKALQVVEWILQAEQFTSWGIWTKEIHVMKRFNSDLVGLDVQLPFEVQ